MKPFIQFVTTATLMCSFLMLNSCSSDSDSQENGTISLETADMTLMVGMSETRAATTNSDATVKYTSSDESVAVVDESGTVTARAVGEAMITAAVDETPRFTAVSVSYRVIVKTPAVSLDDITEEHLGWVVDTCGMAYPAGTENIESVAVIAHVDPEGTHLAVALDDAGATVNRLSAGSSISTWMVQHPVKCNGYWKLPAKDDFLKVFASCGGTAYTDADLTDSQTFESGRLHSMMRAAGGKVMSGPYWMSYTTYYNGYSRYWYMHFYEGRTDAITHWNQGNNTFHVRAFLAFTKSVQ